MVAITYPMQIPLSSGQSLPIEVGTGSMLFILGANGTGKSSLVHRFFTAHVEKAQRLSAHRQTWFESGSVSITGVQRRATENNIRSWDSNPNARWKEVGASDRASMVLYDLVDAQNIRSRGIADAVDEKNIDLACELSQADAPLKLLNEILRLSAIPIEISLRSNEELVASKSGSNKYSIAELSDGERNVLLLTACVLTAKPGSLLLIDEPERHIHRSISSSLLLQLFSRRPDCAFVVSTHDVMLPLDLPTARTILVRSCSRDAGDNITWDLDVLDAPLQLDEHLVGDILGARRNVLFVEGTKQSLDLPLYSLLFPNASVIPKATCRDVEKAVTGIREAESLHWVRAFGIVDGDGRPADDLARLATRGVFPLEVFSVESIYYNPTLQEHIAQRQAALTGGDPAMLLSEANRAAINALASQKRRLSERVAEKAVRDAIYRQLPGREEIASGNSISINIDVAAAVSAEEARFDKALANSNLAQLISRYPVRETSALSEIVRCLGFQNRTQYEASIRKLLLDNTDVLAFVRGLFGALSKELL